MKHKSLNNRQSVYITLRELYIPNKLYKAVFKTKDIHSA